MKMKKSILTRIWALLLALLIACTAFTGCGSDLQAENNENSSYVEQSDDIPQDVAAATEDRQRTVLDETGSYTSKEDVALYLQVYGKLPDNFMTKKEAQALGWSGGGLDDYAEGMCIGGDRFGNYDEKLPVTEGITYHECDINTLHKSKRGAERLVYSTDGHIYYTNDHYNTFTELYNGEE